MVNPDRSPRSNPTRAPKRSAGGTPRRASERDSLVGDLLWPFSWLAEAGAEGGFDGDPAELRRHPMLGGVLGAMSVALMAVPLALGLRRWAHRVRDPMGWNDLEREIGRSARRFVRETAATSTIRPTVLSASSRITNRVRTPASKASTPIDG